MVYVEDLMRGLVALQEADEATLAEPEHGYCIPGLSFTPNELFAEIRKHHPGFGFCVKLDKNMDTFAKLWPDDLATEEPLRDLGYKPEVKLEEMVANVLAAHDERNVETAKAFREMDSDGDGTLSRVDVEKHIRRYLVRGRSDVYSEASQADVGDMVDRFMKDLAFNKDGLISWQAFSEWNRSNTVDAFVGSSSVQ